MLSRRFAGLPGAWGTMLSIAALMAFASAGLAQQGQTDKTKATNPGQSANKTQKASPELEKAQAEVKTLHEQMHKLHEQMHATREKMHKAYANLAKLEGPNTTGFAHRFGRHHGMRFANWGGPRFWRARWMGGPWAHRWARFNDGEMVHHGGAAGGQDVNAQLNHLQHEIDALRSQLQKQASPRQDR